MKVKVKVGDSVTLKQECNHSGEKERRVGKLVYKMGTVYSVYWEKPKEYNGGYTFVSEKCLAVLLTRNDPRWKVA